MPKTTPDHRHGPVRVALYTRISPGGHQRSQEGSLETQAASLRSAVALRTAQGKPHNVVAVLREEDRTGGDMKRPELRKLERMVKDGKIDLVMVTRIDRLSRSLLDFLYLYETFEKHDVQFISMKETFDTTTAIGEAMLKLVLVFAELERKQTAERTQVAMQSRAERGLWNGGAPMLGYQHLGAGKLGVVESEAAVVRSAFEQMLELRSARAVARWLNAQGHRQKRYKSRRRGDVGQREFTPHVVANMLKNRRYLGEVSNRGQWYPGKHDAIVDPEVFARVQGFLDQNRKMGRKSKPTSKHFYLLTGKLRCGLCEDYALTTSTVKNKIGKLYPYYRCVSETKKAKSNCTLGHMAAEKLENAVMAVVREAARDRSIVEQAIEETERILREEMAPSRERLEGLRRDRDSVKRDLDQGFAALTSGELQDVGYFGQRMRDLDERFQQLESAIVEEEVQLHEATNRRLNRDLAVQALQGFDTAFEHLTPSERKEFLDLMIDQVVVFPDHIEVALYEGSRASVALEKVARAAKGRGKGAAAEGAQNDRTPVDGKAGEQGFVLCVDWLRRRDSNSRPGG